MRRLCDALLMVFAVSVVGFLVGVGLYFWWLIMTAAWNN